MIKETDYNQDDKTVLLDRQGHGPASGPLTDFAAPPRFEQLEERMIYAARLRPAETFNVSLNSLVAAASEPGRTVTNGMSEYARSGENINGALLVVFGILPAGLLYLCEQVVLNMLRHMSGMS